MKPPFVTRLRIANYKSIRAAEVSLGACTILLGPNGSGKSNILDALAFLAEAVATTPEQAIVSRGGLDEIMHRPSALDDKLGIAVDVQLPWGTAGQVGIGSYGFEIAGRDEPGRRPFEVVREQCRLKLAADPDKRVSFSVRSGKVDAPGFAIRLPDFEPDQLFLPQAGAMNLNPLTARLRSMAFYNFQLDELRSLRPAFKGARLGTRGEHLGDVIGAIRDLDGLENYRTEAYLRWVLPGLVHINRRYEGSMVTVEVSVDAGPDKEPVRVGPLGISDGTLTAAALLAALFQPDARFGRISLIGIEEPATGIHPGSIGAFFDALTEASEWVQVLTSSHSPDLLDSFEDMDLVELRAVAMEDGETLVGEINEVSQGIVRDHHSTVGEELRQRQLSPQPSPPANGRFDVLASK